MRVVVTNWDNNRVDIEISDKYMCLYNKSFCELFGDLVEDLYDERDDYITGVVGKWRIMAPIDKV